jgi:hypothetical protein
MRWNSWVVQYDAESQIALVHSGAAQVRKARREVGGFVRAAAFALGLAAAVLGAVATVRALAGDPLAKRVARFEKLAARHGAARELFEGPVDHAERFALIAGDAGTAVRRFGAAAAACRYGRDRADAAALAELDALLARVRGDIRGAPRR